jgi:pilus assembly protein FimV
VPIPTPTPVMPETPATAVAPDGTKPVDSTPKAESTAKPAPVITPKEPEPVPESPSTWHALLLPLAGLAGVTALGILLFSLLTARRRRQEQEEEDIAEDDIESDLVLDRPSELETAPEPRAASRAAGSFDAVSLDKGGPAHRPPVEPASVPVMPGIDEPPMSGLTDFDAETDEADVLSEADIYIAYGRHREACDLLNKELRRYPQRLDIKYKLAEALAAAGEADVLRDLLDAIRASGGDSEEPAQWARMQRLLQELAPNAPLAPATPSLTPTAVAAASAGLAGAAAASESRESMAVPELESVVALGPESGSVEDLLLDLGDSGPLEFEEAPDSKPSLDSLKLELDSGAAVPEVEEIEQAIEGGDIDSILPLPEDSVGLDLDLGLPDEPPKSAERAPTVAGPQAGDGILDLDLEVPSLGELDLSIDDLGRLDEPLRSPEPPILEPSDKADESLDALDSGLSQEQESVPSDLLSSQWQIDSGIWDETATKLDLARAYVEMDDKEAAREILEEVMAEGREEQRNEARAMLERLG